MLIYLQNMKRLGVEFTTKASECTHLVARSIVRTEKFLSAMAVGPIILTEKWIHTCVSTKHLLSTLLSCVVNLNAEYVIEEEDYILKDPTNEEKYDFVLDEALERARSHKGKLFAGITFLITRKVPVEATLLKNVVTAGGGQVRVICSFNMLALSHHAFSQVVLNATPTPRIRQSVNKYVISCAADVSIWRPLAHQGVPIYSQELILNSALRQELDWDNPNNKVQRSD